MICLLLVKIILFHKPLLKNPDFGYAVILLSHFNTCPASCHHAATISIVSRVSFKSSSHGIWYWCCTSSLELPPTDYMPGPVKYFELDFPVLDDPVLASSTCDNLLVKIFFIVIPYQLVSFILGFLAW
jgi:hypothetical protein